MPSGAALPHFYARDELVKVRELLGIIEPTDYTLKNIAEAPGGRWVDYSSHDQEMCLDGKFTADELFQIAMYMVRADKLKEQIVKLPLQSAYGHHGELPGMWDESDLIGGEADCAECEDDWSYYLTHDDRQMNVVAARGCTKCELQEKGDVLPSSAAEYFMRSYGKGIKSERT